MALDETSFDLIRVHPYLEGDTDMTYSQPRPPWQQPTEAVAEPRPIAPDLPPWREPKHSGMAKPRRKRRVFLWIFLAIQLLFVVWLIAGAASGTDIHAQAMAYCHAHPDQFVPFSQCVSDYGNGSKVGSAIGLGLIVVLWAVVDIILGVSYGVYRLATRR